METCHYCAAALNHLRVLYTFDGYLFCNRGCALAHLIETQNLVDKQISVRTNLAGKVLDACGEEIPNNIM